MPTDNLRLHSPNCISVSVLFDAIELSAATVFSSDGFSASLASRFYTSLDTDASSVPAAGLAFFFLRVTPALPLSFQDAAGGPGVVKRCLEKVKAVRGCRSRRCLWWAFSMWGGKLFKQPFKQPYSNKLHRRLIKL